MKDFVVLLTRHGELLARRQAEYTGGPKPFTHNGIAREAAMPYLSDEEMAGLVRMLMRDDIGHEAVVCAARDRILHLSQAMVSARDAVLEEAATEVESAGGDSTEFHARRIRALKTGG